MVSPEALERVLRDFNFTYDTKVCGILTKTGRPLALQANAEVEGETFSTMVATLVGSAEVLYHGLGLATPQEILARGEDGEMLVVNLGRNAFFVAVGGEASGLRKRAAEASEALRRVLEPLRPLEKFT